MVIARFYNRTARKIEVGDLVENILLSRTAEVLELQLDTVKVRVKAGYEEWPYSYIIYAGE